MTTTKLYSYKLSVRHKLVKEFKWNENDAFDWIKKHHDYLKAMWESACPSRTTAGYIDTMKKEKKDVK